MQNTCFGRSYDSKKRKFDTFDALKKKLRLPDQLLVDFLFCPHPLDVDDANATWSTEKEIPTGTRIDFSILKVPESLLELPPRKKKTSNRRPSNSSATAVS